MKKLICAGFIVLFLLTSCSFGGKSESAAVAALEATRVAQFAAATAKAAAESLAASAVPPTAYPTETVAALPTETATPEPTATPTEIPVVKAVSNVNANCRSGPDKVFPLVELLNAGTSTLVIGQYGSNGQWWKVRTDADKECWVLGDNVSLSGEISIVAMLESPPTPTPVPAPKWNGSWTIWFSTGPGNPEINAQQYKITLNQSGQNLSGTIVASWTIMAIYGFVSEDGMSVSGEMDSSTYADNFKFYLVRDPSNLNQFRGKFYYIDKSNDGVFCGYQNSAGFPTPCRP